VIKKIVIGVDGIAEESSRALRLALEREKSR